MHESAGGSIAVVGVLFTEGPEHRALKPFWRDFADNQGSVEGKFDLLSLLPGERTSWRYRGSLTTPPCTEGVSWIILSGHLSMSAEQIDRFAAIFPNNFRPVQPLGDRTLQFG